jgi:hypothetical protein
VGPNQTIKRGQIKLTEALEFPVEPALARNSDWPGEFQVGTGCRQEEMGTALESDRKKSEV